MASSARGSVLPALTSSSGNSTVAFPSRLGPQAGFLGLHLVILPLDDIQLGLEIGVVEADQDIAGLDVVPFANGNRFHDAAPQVLNRLALGIDADHATTGDAFVQGGQGGPQHEAAETDDQGHHAETDDRFLVGIQTLGILGLDQINHILVGVLLEGLIQEIC